jgi:hypothetical protein
VEEVEARFAFDVDRLATERADGIVARDARAGFAELARVARDGFGPSETAVAELARLDTARAAAGSQTSHAPESEARGPASTIGGGVLESEHAVS